MSELLTTRELQNLLKVDRITIYRMLEQGRLPGFKVGGQWRFPRREIEAWLEAQRDALALTEEAVTSAPAPVPLPLRCVQNVQDVFAEALDVAAVTTDLAGNPLTRISHACAFCSLVLSSAEGRRRCTETWKAGANLGPSPVVKMCHAGLSCVSVVVRVGGNPEAVFSACQFVMPEADKSQSAWAADLHRMAMELGLDESDLAARRDSVRTLEASEVARIFRLVQQLSGTLSEIGDERLALLNRLERIAEMTRL